MNQSPDITKIPNERPQVFILHKGLDRLHKGLEALLDGQKAKPPVAPPLADLRMPAEPARKPRRPTLASVAKQANRAAIAVARYEVKPDGTIVIVTGEPEPDLAGRAPGHPRTHRSATSATMPALPKMDLQRAAA